MNSTKKSLFSDSTNSDCQDHIVNLSREPSLIQLEKKNGSD